MAPNLREDILEDAVPDDVPNRVSARERRRGLLQRQVRPHKARRALMRRAPTVGLHLAITGLTKHSIWMGTVDAYRML